MASVTRHRIDRTHAAKKSAEPASEILRDVWYMAVPGKQIKPGKMLGKRLLGQSILLGRDKEGEVFALRDICPHRGIPLSHGKFDGAEIECCYHGWRFNCQGTCTAIPSLLPTQKFELDRVSAQGLACREVQGNIWVFMPEDASKMPDPLPPIPLVPDVDASHCRLIERSVFPCSIDHAVTGLMDPAHGPYVHRSWWWRSQKSMHEKAKEFAPSHWGFTMLQHKPSSNSKAYKLFRGEVSTEITFTLPSIRVEHIVIGRHRVCGLTTLTPLSETEVELHQMFYWTIPWLTLARPLLRPFIRRFIEQDRDVVDKQQQGLNEDPQLILINDADKPARWYYQLKKELIQSRMEEREFTNPVPNTTLRWCS